MEDRRLTTHIGLSQTVDLHPDMSAHQTIGRDVEDVIAAHGSVIIVIPSLPSWNIPGAYALCFCFCGISSTPGVERLGMHTGRMHGGPAIDHPLRVQLGGGPAPPKVYA